MASGKRTLGAVLRTFFLFFLRYKKIKRKQILINPPTSVVHAHHHMQILPNFLQEAFEGDFNFIDPFGGDSPWHHGRHDILNFFVSVQSRACPCQRKVINCKHL